MEYTTKRHGNILILSIYGDLSFQQNDEFGAILHKCVHDNNADIIVDMTQVNLIDSMVAGHFVAAKRECDLNRRQFGLANVSKVVRSILHSGGADHQVHIYRSIEEAIADLSDRSHGTRKRRLVMNIKCGHQDCIYYTFGKQPGLIVPACEYPYQDDITNGPTCKCYKPDWQQIQETVSLNTPSPFRNSKKKSLYDVRNKAAMEAAREGATPEEDDPEYRMTPTSLMVEPPHAKEPHVAARLNDPNLKPKIATAIERRRPEPSAAEESPTQTESLPSDDPFEEEFFPSTVRTPVEPAPPPPPVKAPQPPPTQQARTDPVIESGPVPREPTPFPPTPHQAPETKAHEEPKPKEEPKIAETPEVVVRKYVEAWNHGEFGREYHYLAARNRAFNEADYVSRRQSLRTAQMQRHGGKITRQEVARVDSCAIDGMHSTVEITRVDRTPLGAMCYCQHFHLVLEDGFWKIQRSEDGELRKNPTKPQKGRVMKAGDFLGKSK